MSAPLSNQRFWSDNGDAVILGIVDRLMPPRRVFRIEIAKVKLSPLRTSSGVVNCL